MIPKLTNLSFSFIVLFVICGKRKKKKRQRQRQKKGQQRQQNMFMITLFGKIVNSGCSF